MSNSDYIQNVGYRTSETHVVSAALVALHERGWHLVLLHDKQAFEKQWQLKRAGIHSALAHYDGDSRQIGAIPSRADCLVLDCDYGDFRAVAMELTGAGIACIEQSTPGGGHIWLRLRGDLGIVNRQWRYNGAGGDIRYGGIRNGRRVGSQVRLHETYDFERLIAWYDATAPMQAIPGVLAGILNPPATARADNPPATARADNPPATARAGSQSLDTIDATLGREVYNAKLKGKSGASWASHLAVMQKRDAGASAAEAVRETRAIETRAMSDGAARLELAQSVVESLDADFGRGSAAAVMAYRLAFASDNLSYVSQKQMATALDISKGAAYRADSRLQALGYMARTELQVKTTELVRGASWRGKDVICYRICAELTAAMRGVSHECSTKRG